MEKQKKTSLINQMLEVLYAPQKAFKEITQNPKYAGPFLVLILFVAANLAFAYVVVSKTYVEQTLPTGEKMDEWTENATLWTSYPGVSITENFVDFINGTAYGNRSIEFSVVDSKKILMQLDSIGPANCSGPDGYKEIYFRAKMINPEEKPANASIYMLSSSTEDYFYYDLTGDSSNITRNVWGNITIRLGNEKWTNSTANADWGRITGLKLEFEWPEGTNTTLLVDGLFFRGVFKTPMQIAAASILINFSLTGLMQFVVQWVLFAGLIYVLARAFGAKVVWRPLMVVVGFVLITMCVQMALNAAAYSTLPSVHYRLEFLGGVQGEYEKARNAVLEETAFVSDFSSYLRIAVYIWTIALGAIATRLLTGFSLMKSTLITIIALLVSVILVGLVIGV